MFSFSFVKERRFYETKKSYIYSSFSSTFRGCKSNVAPSSEEVVAPTGITITGPGSLAEEESAFLLQL